MNHDYAGGTDNDGLAGRVSPFFTHVSPHQGETPEPRKRQEYKEKQQLSLYLSPFHPHGKYQFAFLANHMLTMNCVYFNIWQIKQARPADFKKGLIGFARDEKALPWKLYN